MPDFRIIKEKPRRFLGCHGREVWFQIKLPDGQKAALFSLLFADRKLVYNLMFTVSSNDVEAAMPAILQSVALG